MGTVAKSGKAPKRKEEIPTRSHRAWCPSTEKIEWFRNETVYRAFLWMESRPDVAHVEPNPLKIEERFGNERSFPFELRVRDLTGGERLYAVRNASSMHLDKAGELVPAYWERVNAYCARQGLVCKVLSDDMLIPFLTRIGNWQRVLPYLHEAANYPEVDLGNKLVDMVNVQGLMSIGALVRAFSEHTPQSVVAQIWFSVWQRRLNANLDSEAWSVNTLIGPSDVPAAAAQPAKAPSQPANPLPIEPDSPETWPNIPATTIENKTKRKTYERNKKMIWAVLVESQSIASAARSGGIRPRSLSKIIERCRRITPSGEPWGWAGAIPHTRWPYERVENAAPSNYSDDPTAKGHALTRFFKQHPEIETVVMNAALPKKNNVTPRSGRRKPQYQAVWKKFLEACEKAEIAETAWPYTTQNKGREAIRRYCKKLVDRYPTAHLEVNTGDTGVVVWDATQPKEPGREIIRPYEKFQADGHNSNAYTGIAVPDMVGMPIALPLGRLWFIVSVDLGSRAAMGASVTPELNYASIDLLDCVSDGILPETHLRRCLPDSSYRDGAGMPPSIWPFCTWRSFDTLQLDNALSHVSRETQERMVETCGATIITNLPSHPTSNAVAERFFGSFDSIFGAGPTSTGSNPADLRRESPEKVAVQRQIWMYHIEGLAHSVLANYNATPHEALNGKSPLQYLHDWHQRDPLLARYVPDQCREDLPLYYRTFPATIQRNAKQGGRCYVKWKYSRYTNDILASRPSLRGTKVLLVVDSRDARRVWLFTRSGEALGQLEPQDRWALRAHTLRERRLIGTFQRLALIDPDTTDPVGDLHQVIE
ncbi:MAG: hypothetical protein AAFY44_17475, partial [Pseudomonadota bacterium]